MSEKAAKDVYGGFALGLDSRGYGGSSVADSAAGDGAYRTTYVSLGVRMSVKRKIYAGLSFCVPVGVTAPGDSGPDVAESDLSAAIAFRANAGIQVPIADIGDGSLRFVFDFAYVPTSLFTFKTTMIDDDDNEVPVTIDGPATWSMRFGLSHVVPL